MSISKTMPKGRARPLGTPRTKLRLILADEKTLAPDTPSAVASSQSPLPAHERISMTLTFKGLNRRSSQAIYVGARTSLRVPVANFPDKVPTPTISVDGLLGPRTKIEKVKLTKEQRAALPKPTAAERVARMEARLAKAKAKLQADVVSM